MTSGESKRCVTCDRCQCGSAVALPTVNLGTIVILAAKDNETALLGSRPYSLCVARELRNRYAVRRPETLPWLKLRSTPGHIHTPKRWGPSKSDSCSHLWV